MPELLPLPGLSTVEGLVHGVTQRAGGVSRGPFASWNFSRSVGDDADAVTRNGAILSEVMGAPGRVRFPHQVHGNVVRVLDAPPDGPLGECDAIATDVPGLALGVLGADCPGVLLVDPVRRALAVAHSGWRGTLAGIVPAAIAALATRYGTEPRDLRVGIGPGISAAAYEVGPEVVDAFRSGFPDATSCVTPGRGDRSWLDLHGAIRLQLARAGVPEASVGVLDLCTHGEPALFFSHRRDGPHTGRHALVAMWR